MDSQYRKLKTEILCLTQATLLAGVACTAAAGEATQRDIEQAGDALQVGLPLAALALTFLEYDDRDVDSAAPLQAGAATMPGSMFDGLTLNGTPRHDLAVAMVRTEVVTYALKYSIDAERPNGSGQSFPSGHTAAAFTGAEFIRIHYGNWSGAAAYVAAGFTGWSRVATGNHWPRDVAAGAVIGILSNHELTRWEFPFGRLAITPTAMDFEGAASGLKPALQFQLSF